MHEDLSVICFGCFVLFMACTHSTVGSCLCKSTRAAMCLCSFLEMGEATIQGAARETLEEANACVHSLVPFVHLDIPVIGQAYLLFRCLSSCDLDRVAI